ncbi:RidA family protein [Gottschalkiaceae bacterium SANA]|nr:RidA family protein [Gottschalkiaceae bacterium SANA]
MGKELPYSKTLMNNSIGFVSGQLAIDSEDELVGNDISSQTKAALNNLFAAVEQMGAAKSDIMFVNVYLQDIVSDFEKMNEVYSGMLEGNKPCRVTVGATLVDPKYLVEISAIIVK